MVRVIVEGVNGEVGESSGSGEGEVEGWLVVSKVVRLESVNGMKSSGSWFGGMVMVMNW